MVEITIAIGLFAFCILGIVGLLGIAIDTSRASQQDSSSTGLLRTVDSLLREMTADKATPPPTDPSVPPDPSVPSLTTAQFFFDTSGNYLPGASASDREAAIAVTASYVDPSEIKAPGLLELATARKILNDPMDSSFIPASSYTLGIWLVKIKTPPTAPTDKSYFLGHALIQ